MDECKSVESCKCIVRISNALQFHAKQKSNNDVVLRFFDEYRNLLNDYSHILHHHLNKRNNDNNLQFYSVYKQVTKYIKCNIKQCEQYTRNNRIRERDNHIQKHNEEAIFYINTLDTIHCNLLHSYDQGFKINSYNYDDKTYSNHKSEYNDTKLNSLRTHIIDKRKYLERIAGHDRIQNNKFTSDFSDNNNNGNITEKIQSENDMIKFTKFNFGHRFYYWIWYKNNTDEDLFCNPGYTYNTLYVAPFYSNFKQEILSILNINNYQNIWFKSRKYLKESNYTKHLKEQER
eukprot:248108_1